MLPDALLRYGNRVTKRTQKQIIQAMSKACVPLEYVNQQYLPSAPHMHHPNRRCSEQQSLQCHMQASCLQYLLDVPTQTDM